MQIVMLVNNEDELEELINQVEYLGGTVTTKNNGFPKYFAGIAGREVIEIEPDADAKDWICGCVATETE